MSGLQHHDDFEPYYAGRRPSSEAPADTRAGRMRERIKRLSDAHRNQHRTQRDERDAEPVGKAEPVAEE